MGKKKSRALLFLQTAWPCAALALIINSALVAWFGTVEQAAAWSGMLPILSGIVTLMGVAAGGGPLVADQIKAKAGVLGAPPGEG